MPAVGLRDVQESLASSVATAYLALVDRSSLPAAVPCRFAARSMNVVVTGAVSPPLARLGPGAAPCSVREALVDGGPPAGAWSGTDPVMPVKAAVADPAVGQLHGRPIQ